MDSTKKIIMGVDPGTVFMGFGIIELNNKKLKFVEMGTLNLSKVSDSYEKLYKIHERILELIHLYQPTTFAIEAPFFGKNVQSMLKLGRAQGVALAAALQAGLKASEYSPRKVKKSITGNGNASKEQVSEMIGHILHIEVKPKHLDATDALAVAICHHFQSQSVFGASSGAKNWKEFIRKHPDRVKQ